MNTEKTPFEIIYQGVIDNLENELKGKKVDWKTIAGNCADVAKIEIEKHKADDIKLPIYWSTKDFEALASQLFEELKENHFEEFKDLETWEQLYDKSKFPKMLKEMIDNHDCETGITWLTLEYYLGKCEIKKL